MIIENNLTQNLRELRLPGILDNLEMRFKEAEENSLGYIEFLSFLIQDQMDTRNANTFQKNLKAAKFGQVKTLEGFDFRFNQENLPPKFIRDLATCLFIDMKENFIIAGPPGIGKTHVAKAIGYEAVRKKYSVRYIKFYNLLQLLQEAEITETFSKVQRKYISPVLLILDDFALRKMTVKEAEIFYHLVDERLGTGSLIITSNRPIEDWIGVFPDPVIGGAILDRIASNSHKIITKEGKSYRKEGQKEKAVQ